MEANTRGAVLRASMPNSSPNTLSHDVACDESTHSHPYAFSYIPSRTEPYSDIGRCSDGRAFSYLATNTNPCCCIAQHGRPWRQLVVQEIEILLSKH